MRAGKPHDKLTPKSIIEGLRDSKAAVRKGVLQHLVENLNSDLGDNIDRYTLITHYEAARSRGPRTWGNIAIAVADNLQMEVAGAMDRGSKKASKSDRADMGPINLNEASRTALYKVIRRAEEWGSARGGAPDPLRPIACTLLQKCQVVLDEYILAYEPAKGVSAQQEAFVADVVGSVLNKVLLVNPDYLADMDAISLARLIDSLDGYLSKFLPDASAAAATQLPGAKSSTIRGVERSRYFFEALTNIARNYPSEIRAQERTRPCQTCSMPDGRCSLARHLASCLSQYSETLRDGGGAVDRHVAQCVAWILVKWGRDIDGLSPLDRPPPADEVQVVADDGNEEMHGSDSEDEISDEEGGGRRKKGGKRKGKGRGQGAAAAAAAAAPAAEEEFRLLDWLLSVVLQPRAQAALTSSSTQGIALTSRDPRLRGSLLLGLRAAAALIGDDDSVDAPGSRVTRDSLWTLYNRMFDHGVGLGGEGSDLHPWGEGAVQGRCAIGRSFYPALDLGVTLLLGRVRAAWGAGPEERLGSGVSDSESSDSDSDDDSDMELGPRAKRARLPPDDLSQLVSDAVERPALWGPVLAELIRTRSELLPPRLLELLLEALTRVLSGGGATSSYRAQSIIPVPSPAAKTIWLLRIVSAVARSAASPAPGAQAGQWEALLQGVLRLADALGGPGCDAGSDTTVAEEAAGLLGAATRRRLTPRAAVLLGEFLSYSIVTDCISGGLGADSHAPAATARPQTLQTISVMGGGLNTQRPIRVAGAPLTATAVHPRHADTPWAARLGPLEAIVAFFGRGGPGGRPGGPHSGLRHRLLSPIAQSLATFNSSGSSSFAFESLHTDGPAAWMSLAEAALGALIGLDACHPPSTPRPQWCPNPEELSREDGGRDWAEAVLGGFLSRADPIEWKALDQPLVAPVSDSAPRLVVHPTQEAYDSVADVLARIRDPRGEADGEGPRDRDRAGPGPGSGVGQGLGAGGSPVGRDPASRYVLSQPSAAGIAVIASVLVNCSKYDSGVAAAWPPTQPGQAPTSGRGAGPGGAPGSGRGAGPPRGDDLPLGGPGAALREADLLLTDILDRTAAEGWKDWGSDVPAALSRLAESLHAGSSDREGEGSQGANAAVRTPVASMPSLCSWFGRTLYQSFRAGLKAVAGADSRAAARGARARDKGTDWDIEDDDDEGAGDQAGPSRRPAPTQAAAQPQAGTALGGRAPAQLAYLGPVEVAASLAVGLPEESYAFLKSCSTALGLVGGSGEEDLPRLDRGVAVAKLVLQAVSRVTVLPPPSQADPEHKVLDRWLRLGYKTLEWLNKVIGTPRFDPDVVPTVWGFYRETTADEDARDFPVPCALTGLTAVHSLVEATLHFAATIRASPDVEDGGPGWPESSRKMYEKLMPQLGTLAGAVTGVAIRLRTDQQEVIEMGPIVSPRCGEMVARTFGVMIARHRCSNGLDLPIFRDGLLASTSAAVRMAGTLGLADILASGEARASLGKADSDAFVQVVIGTFEECRRHMGLEAEGRGLGVREESNVGPASTALFSAAAIASRCSILEPNLVAVLWQWPVVSDRDRPVARSLFRELWASRGYSGPLSYLRSLGPPLFHRLIGSKALNGLGMSITDLQVAFGAVLGRSTDDFPRKFCEPMMPLLAPSLALAGRAGDLDTLSSDEFDLEPPFPRMLTAAAGLLLPLSASTYEPERVAAAAATTMLRDSFMTDIRADQHFGACLAQMLLLASPDPAPKAEEGAPDPPRPTPMSDVAETVRRIEEIALRSGKAGGGGSDSDKVQRALDATCFAGDRPRLCLMDLHQALSEKRGPGHRLRALAPVRALLTLLGPRQLYRSVLPYLVVVLGDQLGHVSTRTAACGLLSSLLQSLLDETEPPSPSPQGEGKGPKDPAERLGSLGEVLPTLVPRLVDALEGPGGGSGEENIAAWSLLRSLVSDLPQRAKVGLALKLSGLDPFPPGLDFEPMRVTRSAAMAECETEHDAETILARLHSLRLRARLIGPQVRARVVEEVLAGVRGLMAKGEEGAGLDPDMQRELLAAALLLSAVAAELSDTKLASSLGSLLSLAGPVDPRKVAVPVALQGGRRAGAPPPEDGGAGGTQGTKGGRTKATAGTLGATVIVNTGRTLRNRGPATNAGSPGGTMPGSYGSIGAMRSAGPSGPALDHSDPRPWLGPVIQLASAGLLDADVAMVRASHACLTALLKTAAGRLALEKLTDSVKGAVVGLFDPVRDPTLETDVASSPDPSDLKDHPRFPLDSDATWTVGSAALRPGLSDTDAWACVACPAILAYCRDPLLRVLTPLVELSPSVATLVLPEATRSIGEDYTAVLAATRGCHLLVPGARATLAAGKGKGGKKGKQKQGKGNDPEPPEAAEAAARRSLAGAGNVYLSLAGLIGRRLTQVLTSRDAPQDALRLALRALTRLWDSSLAAGARSVEIDKLEHAGVVRHTYQLQQLRDIWLGEAPYGMGWESPYWVEVSPIDAARGALRAGDPFSALKYIELVLEGGASPTTDEAQREEARTVMLAAFKMLNDPDLIYGAVSAPPLTGLLGLWEHEGSWDRAAVAHDILAGSGPSASGSVLGALQSLSQLGLNHVLRSALQEFGGAQRAAGEASEVPEFAFEAAWRLGDWSAPQVVQACRAASYSAAAGEGHGGTEVHRAICASLQTLTGGDAHGASGSRVPSSGSLAALSRIVAAARSYEVISLAYGGLESVASVNPRLVRLRMLQRLEEAGGSVATGLHVTAGWEDAAGVIGPKAAYPLVEPLVALEASVRAALSQSGVQEAGLREAAEAARLPLLRLSLARMARKAQQPMRAVPILDALRQEAASLAVTLPALSHRVALEEAKTLRALGHTSIAINAADALTRRLDGVSNITEADRLELTVRATSLSGMWGAETLSVDTNKILHDNLVSAAVQADQMMSTFPMHPGGAALRARAWLRVARFADQLLKREEARRSSQEYLTAQAVLLENVRALNLQQGYVTKLEGVVRIDQNYIRTVREREAAYLKEAVGGYLKCLRAGGAKQATTCVFRVFYLWCKHGLGEGAGAAGPDPLEPILGKVEPLSACLPPKLSEELLSVPSHYLLPITYQAVSRLSQANQSNPFQDQLHSVVRRLAKDHPYHLLPQLHALWRAGEAQKASQPNAPSGAGTVQDRSRFASAMLTQLQSVTAERLQELAKEMKVLLEFYQEAATWDGLGPGAAHAAAAAPRDAKRERPEGEVPLPGSMLRKISNFKRVTPLTKPPEVDPTCQYDPATIPVITGVRPTARFAGGINHPLIIDVDTAWGPHRELCKSQGEDLRGDAVMQQMFSLCNDLLDRDPECRRRSLRMRTYRVAPVSPKVGVLEFVDNTTPLGWLLVGKSRMAGAHLRHFKGDQWLFLDVYHNYKAAREARDGTNPKQQPKSTNVPPKEAWVRSPARMFQDLAAVFPPVLGQVLLERFPEPSRWLEARTAFTRSTAVCSMVGYIVGLGDRHLENILMDLSTAECVHIDLGIAFDQGQLLRIPELIPFRLSPDIIHGMGPAGLEGPFRRCCEATLQVLRGNRDALITLVEVFLHDPLFDWVMTETKANKRQRNQGELDEVPAPLPGVRLANTTSERTLLGVKLKLDGSVEPGEQPLGIEGQVRALIQRATDPNRLGVVFEGKSDA